MLGLLNLASDFSRVQQGHKVGTHNWGYDTIMKVGWESLQVCEDAT